MDNMGDRFLDVNTDRYGGQSVGYFLCVVHSDFNDLGRIGRLFSNGLIPFKKVNFLNGDRVSLNGTLKGVVVFGGTMSASDLHLPGLREECAFLISVLKANVPLIGICLGGQLISQELGCKISRPTHRLVEIGFHLLEPTPAGRLLFTEALYFYQWHSEDMPAPDGATVLAKTTAFPVQAYSYGNALALQFHPDATVETVRSWCALGRRRLDQPGAQPEADQIRFAPVYEKQIDRWTSSMLDQWFGLTKL